MRTMCLIIFAHRVHPDFPLLLAANRDEFHARPTAPSQFWPEAPGILAGRDLQAGGTWMGISRSGRFAAITNFRDPQQSAPAPRSRGELPTRWLCDTSGSGPSAEDYLAEVAADSASYAGFNLLIGSADALWYYSNAGPQAAPAKLGPGLYGLSNASLDTPWPKVNLGKARLGKIIEGGDISHEQLRSTVQDEQLAELSALEAIGLGGEMDRLLSAQFIHAGHYGTRASTTLWRDSDGTLSWCEVSYDSEGRETGLVTNSLRTKAPD